MPEVSILNHGTRLLPNSQKPSPLFLGLLGWFIIHCIFASDMEHGRRIVFLRYLRACLLKVVHHLHHLWLLVEPHVVNSPETVMTMIMLMTVITPTVPAIARLPPTLVLAPA